MDVTTPPENMEQNQETGLPMLMVSGFVCPQGRCALSAEVRRGMPIRSIEGLEAGTVAAVVLNRAHQQATHILLGRLPERRGYWLVPVDLIADVHDQAVQLAISLQAVDALPRWHSP